MYIYIPSLNSVYGHPGRFAASFLEITITFDITTVLRVTLELY